MIMPTSWLLCPLCLCPLTSPLMASDLQFFLSISVKSLWSYFWVCPIGRSKVWSASVCTPTSLIRSNEGSHPIPVEVNKVSLFPCHPRCCADTTVRPSAEMSCLGFFFMIVLNYLHPWFINALFLVRWYCVCFVAWLYELSGPRVCLFMSEDLDLPPFTLPAHFPSFARCQIMSPSFDNVPDSNDNPQIVTART